MDGAAALAAHAERHDRTADLPRDGPTVVHDASLLTLTVHSEHGGPGDGLADTVRALTALGRGDQLLTATTLVDAVALAVDRGEQVDAARPGIAKTVATTAAIEAVRRAVAVIGNAGLSLFYRFEDFSLLARHHDPDPRLRPGRLRPAPHPARPAGAGPPFPRLRLGAHMTVTPLHQDRAVDADLFRALLRRHAAAVVVITAPGAPPAGFTATSFTSVSLDPPLVSFCLAKTASAWPAVESANTIAVHVLTREQEHVARTFATRGIDRFAAHGAWRAGPDGVPLLDGVLATIVCRVTQRVEAGDHTIVLAAPELGEHHADATVTPLVYHGGTYAHLKRSA